MLVVTGSWAFAGEWDDIRTHCVGELVKPCDAVYATLQEAHDAADRPGESIIISPGVHNVGRAVLTKSVRIRSVNRRSKSVLSDANLEPGGPFITVRRPAGSTDPVKRVIFEDLDFEIGNSSVVISFPDDVEKSFVQRNTITCLSPGITGVEYAEHGNAFSGRVDRTTFTNCATGVFMGAGTRHFRIEKNEFFTKNGDTAIQYRARQGQIFWNDITCMGGDCIALKIEGSDLTDINNNNIFGGTAQWLVHEGRSNDSIEFDHNVYKNPPNGTPFLVETSPGVFTEEYTLDPSCGTSWSRNQIVIGSEVEVLPRYRTSFCSFK